MEKNLKKCISKLARLDVNRDVRRASHRAEENVKIKIVIPLLEALGYDKIEDMDFEHYVSNKRADIALLVGGKAKLIIEAKDLDENLDHHVEQVLGYAFNKGVEYVIVTNGNVIRLYKSFITGIPEPKDRLIYETTREGLPTTFKGLYELVAKENLPSARKLEEQAELVRGNITAEILIKDLATCKAVLYKSIRGNFTKKYAGDDDFREKLDNWANTTGMDPKDPDLLDKLCKEGAYTLINRLLFLRVCEDKGHIKPKLTSSSLEKWREMVEFPHNLLRMAFEDMVNAYGFEALYRYPLFDNISYDDIEWDEATIDYIIEKMSNHDFSKITRDILGKTYEQHISKEERKDLGQFYTPDFVIDYILDRVYLSTEKKILDPACGSGGFLLKTYDRLRGLYYKDGWADDKVHEAILNRNLYGIDINPFATQLTVMNLLLKDLEYPTPKLNIVEADTLDRGFDNALDLDTFKTDSPMNKIFGGRKRASMVKLLGEGPFDIVVGNPPYRSSGLRGIGKLPKEKEKIYKELYPNSAEYKINLYSLFIDRGIQLTKEGGYTGFILPDSFLLGRYFSKIRRFILDSCRIKEIVLFEKDFWKLGVVGRPVILILRKEKNKKNRINNKLKVTYCDKVRVNDELSTTSFKYKQSYFENAPLNRFRLFFSKTDKEFVEKVEVAGTALGNVVSFASGLIGKGRKESITSEKKLGNKWLPGLLSGGEINRYLTTYGGNFILFDKGSIKSGFDEPEYFEPKILMRQTGDRLIGTYDNDNFLCLNNLHIGNLKDKDYDLRYILGILNSALMNYYYQVISLEKGRAMAQTDIETIELLPVKTGTKRQQDEVVNLVDAMLELNKKAYELQGLKQYNGLVAEIKKTDAAIDKIICDIYGFKWEDFKRLLGTSSTWSGP